MCHASLICKKQKLNHYAFFLRSLSSKIFAMRGPQVGQYNRPTSGLNE